MSSDQLTYKGTITVPIGTTFTIEGKNYRLSADQIVAYVDHRGAGARIIITDPLNPKTTYDFGPNLSGEEDEIQEAANYVLNVHVTRLDNLRTVKNIRDPEAIEDQQQRKELETMSKELGRLEGFLQAA